MQRYTRIIPLVLFLLTMVGCAGVGQRLEPPRVKLANIRVQEFTVFETVFDVRLRIFNTNETALKIKGIECDLKINDRPFAIGVSDTQTEIPPYGTEVLAIRVYSSVWEILKSVHGLQKTEQLNYNLEGKLRLGVGSFPSTLTFESEGNISLPDLNELKNLE
jgi:LEA14-like dessication related protein